MKTSLNIQDILTERIHAPTEFRRDAIREDEQLYKSIKESGVEQPLVVLASEGVYKVIKGTRRLAAAKALGIAKLPCVVEVLPKGEEELPYMRRMRFKLDEHRQDLLPTQKAKLVDEIKKTHGFNNAQVATYLGVTSDTIGNWTDVLKYPQEVQDAIDSGRVKAHVARPLRNLKPEAQLSLFLKHQDEFSDTKAVKRLHKRFDTEYSPEKKPELYVAPKVSQAIRARPKAKKRVTKNYSHDEKRRLIHDLELQEIEAQLGKQEIRDLKERNNACIPVVAAILRSPKLREMVPGEVLGELQEWSKRYVD